MSENDSRMGTDGSTDRFVARSLWALAMIPLVFLAWSAFRIAGVRSQVAAGAGERMTAAALPVLTLDLILFASPLLAIGVVLLVYRLHRSAESPEAGPRYEPRGEAWTRLMVEQMPAVLWSTDGDLRFTSSRGAGLEDLGLKPDQVVGTTLYEYFNTADPGFPPIASHLRALHGESAVFESNWKGEVFHSFVEPLRTDRSGEVVGTVGVALNVTAARTAQVALKNSEAQLRQSQKMEAVGRLASGVAHDFNNLLTAISGYTDLASRSVPGDGAAARCLGEIRKAGEQASALTRQLLVFSRKQVLEPKVLDLNTIVSEVEGLLVRTIGEDIDLTTRLRPEAGYIRADQGQLSQVILNLAVNARDAMPGGGKLLIETARTELGEPYVTRHTGVAPGTYAVLAISDTGTGMDKATQARLFEPFFTTKEPGEGTGLGLATVYGIVKQSGGNVWVYSEPGQGATFKVYLPVAEEKLVGTPREEEVEAAPEGSETILLVEDDETVRSILSDGLRLSGYKVMEARHGDEALRICGMHEGHIDLLVTDVVMPQMSGREMARRLSRIRPGTRVLFMSGYTESAILQHGLLEGSANFLQKPFTPGALAGKVRAMIDSPTLEHRPAPVTS